MPTTTTTTVPSRSNSLRREEWSHTQNTESVISAPLHVSENTPPRNINLKSGNPFDLPRSTRSNLPQRPSTSGGSASRKVVTEHTTRDDLHLKSLTANRVAVPTLILPDSPQSASLPTPQVTPPSSSQALSKRDSSSELLIADLIEMNARSLGVGMAIESPSQVDNTAASWHLPLVPEVHNETSIISAAMPNSGPKPKNSKWKRFFGVKRAASSSTYYNARSDFMQGHQDIDGSQPSELEYVQKDTRPSTRRAKTVPVLQHDYQDQKDRNGRALTAPPNRFLEGGPMLRVDIPTVRMERYSVMFGSVLQNGNDSQQSSLLARRQATLDKLKTANEAIAAKEREEAEFLSELKRPRRATSPQPGSTPTFSLFPPTASQPKGSSHQYQPTRTAMQRSFTSPTLSPHIETFQSIQSRDETHTITLASTPPHSDEQRNQEHQRWGPDESHLMLSPTSMSDEESYFKEELPKPRFANRDWTEPRSTVPPQPPPATPQSSKVTPPQRARGATLTSSTSSTASSNAAPQNYVFTPFASPPAPIHTGRPTTADEAEAAAAISIARQISVSQRQRQLLIPIKPPKGYSPTGAPRTKTESNSSRPSPEILVEAGADKIGEKKPATPTLVTLAPESQTSRHRYRKSERVILDMA